jgi:YbgC/YbaW family acyl-CoA thioester hydrolase
MAAGSFKSLLRVTWADTDAAGVVHFARYFVFFERAEQEFYRSLGLSFADFRDRGFWFPMVEACCEYKRPARFDDLLEVELTVEELGEKSVKYGFRVVNEGTGVLLAVGHLVAVAADRETERATVLPAEFVEKLRRFGK